MILNRETLDGVRKGFVSLYNTAFTAANPLWKQIAMLVPSTTKDNQYGWLGNASSLREWIGDRVIKNLAEHGYRIENKKWEDTISVSRDNIDDDNIGVYAPLVSMMGYNAAMFPDELVFGLLKGGFTANCYDGQYFFDTDHPVGDGNGGVTSVSNTGGGAGAPWFLLDVSKPIKPVIFQDRRAFEFRSITDLNDSHVFLKDEFIYGIDGRCNVGYGLWQMAYGSKQALTVENYAAARTALSSMKNDNGKPLNVTPTLLVVGPSNEKAALEILQAARNAAGADNVYVNTAKVLVSPYLA